MSPFKIKVNDLRGIGQTLIDLGNHDLRSLSDSIKFLDVTQSIKDLEINDARVESKSDSLLVSVELTMKLLNHSELTERLYKLGFIFTS